MDQRDGKYHEVLLLQFAVWEVEKAKSSSSSSNDHSSYIRVLPKHQDLCEQLTTSVYLFFIEFHQAGPFLTPWLGRKYRS